MCYLVSVELYSIVVHSACSSHQPMESTSLQIELVYLLLKFSSIGNVYLFFILTSSLMFPRSCRYARSRSLPHAIAFDCGRFVEITELLPRYHWKFSLYIYKL